MKPIYGSVLRRLLTAGHQLHAAAVSQIGIAGRADVAVLEVARHLLFARAEVYTLLVEEGDRSRARTRSRTGVAPYGDKSQSDRQEEPAHGW